MIQAISTSPTANATGRTPRVLVFDSGVGGLSVLQEIRQQHRACKLFYSSDNAAFPYGTKSEDELIERVDKVLHQLQALSAADMIVVACNTASTIALPRIRERFSQPVIGVVPAIKPAAKLSTSKTIGLLATPGTVRREYTNNLIQEFATHCQVIRVGSNELVHLAERKLRGNPINPADLAPIVSEFQSYKELDTMVLACTHFPLLKDELHAAMPHITHWVDSGEAIARRVGYWIEELGLSHTANYPPAECTAYFTARGLCDNVESQDYLPENSRQQFNIGHVEYLTITTP